VNRRNGPGAGAAPAREWATLATLTAGSVGCAGLLGAHRAGVPAAVGLAGGALAGALAVLALPSVPRRVSTAAVLGLGGIVVARHAALGSAEASAVALWAIVTAAALVVLARVDHDDLPRAARAGEPARFTIDVVRLGAAVVAAVTIVSAALAPAVADALRRQSQPGRLPSASDYADAPSSLRVNDHLDMATRPRLSDRVVFRVASSRPDFWRAETFDLWDGRTWSHSERVAYPAVAFGTGAFVTPENGAVGEDADTLTQTVHLETVSEVVFAAPTAIRVETSHRLLQRPDGTVIAAAEPFGPGAAYTVVSRRAPATAERLRASEGAPLPPGIERYRAAVPVTARVARLAAEATTGAPTTYDRIRALERWLGAHTRYSLDASPSRPDRDAVDEFLFDTRLGWCQQVSSALAVMLRSLGVPARVATGFVPGQWDRLSGDYVVRERDAHQWVEVFFPGVGWQGFDPTAQVPLAGEARAPGTTSDWLRAHGAWFLVAAAIAAVVAAVRAARALLARRRAAAARPWAERRLTDLERLGTGCGRPRRPSETAREFGAALAAVRGDPDLARAGDLIDTHAFSRAGIAPQDQAWVEAALGRAAAGSARGEPAPV
jgi:transglutaminase-like putative cysteine protease